MSISAFNQPLPASPVKSPIYAATDQSANAALYAEKCSACHNLPKPEEKGFTKSEWRRVVNTMLVKYKASESISNNEADEIVAYLAAFAPKNDAAVNNPYASDMDDVWPVAPVNSRVHNFTGTDSLKIFSRYSTGLSDNKVKCRIVAGATPDASIYQMEQIGAFNGQYALAVDPMGSSNDIDTTVRFQVPGQTSNKSIGIAIGWRGNNRFAFVKYDMVHDNLSVINVDGASHTVLPLDNAKLISVNTGDSSGWHTLRVMVKGTRVKAWVDAVKRLNIDDAQYQAGKVGLVTDGSTNASFSHWIIDYYK